MTESTNSDSVAEVKRFCRSLWGATALIVWFVSPLGAWRWILDSVCAVCSTQTLHVTGDGDVFFDDLIPTGPGLLIVAGLVVAMVGVLWGVASHRRTARLGGLILLSAAVPAAAGVSVNVVCSCRGSWLTYAALLGVSGAAFESVLGLVSGFSNALKQWFVAGDGDGRSPVKESVLYPVLDRISVGVAMLSAGAALLVGFRGVGVSRDVVVRLRGSMTGVGMVLQIYNLSEESRLCQLKMDRGCGCRFSLEGRTSKEFGILEIGCSLMDGDQGTLSVKGYPRAVEFSVQEHYLLKGEGYFHEVARRGVWSEGLSDSPPLSFGQKPSLIGGCVVELKNTSSFETVSGNFTLQKEKQTATDSFTLQPGQSKTFGRVELFAAIRPGDRVRVTAVNYGSPVEYVVKENETERKDGK